MSCIKRIGLDEVRTAIVEAAHKLLSTMRVPAYYLALRQVLLEMKAQFTDYTRFASFAMRARDRLATQQQHSSTHTFESDLRTALLFFADCGMILYFDTPDLRDLIILHPKWLADVMST